MNVNEPSTLFTVKVPPETASTVTDAASSAPPAGAMSFASTPIRTAPPSDVRAVSSEAHGATPGYTTSGATDRAMSKPPDPVVPEACTT